MLTICYNRVSPAFDRFKRLTGLLFCLIAICSAISLNGQTIDSTGDKKKLAPAKQEKAKPAAADKIKRWFELDAFSISTRYRLIRTENGRTMNNQLQYQLAARGQFKFDAKGRYSIRAGLFTGNAINSGWNNTGLGTGNAQSNLYLKQLYFDAKPVKEFEAQFGGITVNNGENTEITGYDNDTYLTGGRVAVRMPKQLYFDEISVTYAYFGDFNQPSVFRRFKNLDKSNYHQFLVRKQLNKRASFSADYTFESGRDTLRQAVKIKIPESRILDTMLFENYQHVDPDRGYGFNLYGENVIRKKITLGGGFARIDRPMSNADRFPQGSRFYANAALKLSPEFSLSSIIIQGVGGLPTPATPRTRFELIFSYNFLETLRRLKIF